MTLLLGGFLLVFASQLLSLRQPVEAATSSTLNFQARLLQSSGALVPDGYYNVEFKLYDAATLGTELWSETYYDSNGATAGNDNRVRVANGYLSVNLGSITPFGSSINWDQELWLTMNIGGTSHVSNPTWDGEMSPRLKLTAVPFAFRAQELRIQSGANSTLLQFAAPTGSNTITLPSATGTVCLTSGNCAGVGGTGDVLQNGNSFGGTMTIGTNDNNSLVLETNNTTAITIDTSQNVTVAGNLTVSGTGASTIAGTLDVAGHAAFGGAAGINDTTLLYGNSDFYNVVTIEEEITDPNVDYVASMVNYLLLNPTTTPAYSVYSVDNEIFTASGNAQDFSTINGTYTAIQHQGTGAVGNIYGYDSSITNQDVGTVTNIYGYSAYLDNYGGGTVSNMYGANIDVYNASGTTSLAVGSDIEVEAYDSGSITNAYGTRLRVGNSGTGTVSSGIGLYVRSAVNSGGGTLTNNYGLLVETQTAGTNDYGIAVGAADTQTLWLSSNADNTSAAAGIAFGSSRDTNLYRSAANTLRTDDSFVANLNLTVNGNTTLGDASGDSLTIQGTNVSIPNNLNFDSNTLFIDAGNNRVGVGTGSPQQKLHVDGNLRLGLNSIIEGLVSPAGGAGGYINFTGSCCNVDADESGYGAWLNYNGYWNGSSWVQPRGSLDTYMFTSNYQAGGWGWYAGSAGGVDGGSFTPVQVASLRGDGTAPGTLQLDGNLNVDGTGTSYLMGNVGIGDSSPSYLLTVGNGDLFGVNSSGNVIVTALGTANTDTVVCRNSSNILSTCSSTFLTSANAFLQGGNSFGTTATLGTNDNNSLVLETNNTTAVTIDTSQNVTVAGNLTVSGNTMLGNATSDTITFTGQVNSNVLPSANDTYNLGSDSLRWADLYLGPSTLHIGTGSGDEGTLSYDTTNNILVVNESGNNIDLRVEGDTDANLLFIDAGTDRIGIGVAAPQHKLHVVGDGRVTGNLYMGEGANGNASIIFDADHASIGENSGVLTLTSVNGIDVASTTNFRSNTINYALNGGVRSTVNFINNDQADLLFQNEISGQTGVYNNTLTLYRNGTVGIGTAVPRGNLDVSGTNAELHVGASQAGYLAVGAQGDYSSTWANKAAIALNTVVLQGTGASGLVVRNHTDTAYGGVDALHYRSRDNGSASSTTFGPASATSGLFFPSSGVSISTSSTERLTVLSGGNVGIGDSSPSYLLTVGNGDLFGVNSSGNVIVTALGTANTDTVVCRNSSNILSTCSSTFLTSANAFLQGGNSFGTTATLGTNDNNSLVLETNNTTAVTIDTSQNVTVAGNLRVTDGPWIGNNANNNIKFNGANHHLNTGNIFSINVDTNNTGTGYFRVTSGANDGAGTELLRVDRSGLVGIGTVSPQHRLHVNGGSAFFETATNSTPLTIARQYKATNHEEIRVGVDDGKAQFHYINDENVSRIQFTLQNTDTESGGGADARTNTPLTLYSDQNGGKVGINTISPSEALEVVGNIVASGTLAVNGNTTLGNASGDSLTIQGTNVSIPNNLNFDSNTLFIDATNNRVGIGTASPGYTLDVLGGYINADRFYIGNSTAYLSRNGGKVSLSAGFNFAADAFYFDASSTNLSRESGTGRILTSGALGVAGDVSQVSYIAAGNFGIGDTSPAALLTVGNGDPFQVDTNGLIQVTNHTSDIELDFVGEFGTNIYTQNSFYFSVDSNNNSTETFNFLNGAGGTVLQITETANMLLGHPSLAGTLQVSDGSSHTVSITVPSISASYTLTLPTTDGNSDECLKTNGSGVLSWGTCGGGASAKRHTLTPEYAGSTLSADGSSNSGIMTSDFVTGLASNQGYKHNYYHWTTSQSSAQDYDIVVTYQLPTTYSSMGAASTFKAWAYAQTTTGGVINWTMQDVDGTQCFSQNLTLTTNTWVESGPGSLGSCSFAANDIVVFRFKMTATSSTANLRLGEFRFDVTE